MRLGTVGIVFADIMSKIVIREWAQADRPREKLMEQGRRVVTDAELLAILIGSGTTEETAVELCRRVLASVGNDLLRLSKLEVHELCQFKGIGHAKAVTIIAALELGRRRQGSVLTERPLVNKSGLAYGLLRHHLEDLSHEEFWVLFLNAGCRPIEKQLIGRGGDDFTPVDIRVILRSALSYKASGLILAHNHPSGTLSPSVADCDLTEKIQAAAEIMDISLHDHIIITDSDYYSFRDEGLL